MGRRPGTGCITCRIRHVKCDETKPNCLRCRKDQRVCDGYVPRGAPLSRRQLTRVVQTISVLGPVSRALSPLALSHASSPRTPSPPKTQAGSEHDLILFDFFRRTTAPGTGIFAASGFWTQHLLQLAHAEPAIWHATIAIGALHRNLDLDFSEGPDRSLARKAVVHYGRAMELAQNIESPSVILALSLTLNAAANLLYRFEDMSEHLLAGLRMIHDHGCKSTETPHLTGALMRMDLGAMTFNDSQAPYPFVEINKLRGVADAGTLREDQSITSYDMAASTLFVLMRRFILLSQSGVVSVEEYHASHATIQRDLQAWELKMATFENRQLKRSAPPSTERSRTSGNSPALSAHSCTSAASDDEAIIAKLSVRFYHVFLRLIFTASLAGDETRWDGHLSHFEHMERLGAALARLLREHEASSVSLEPGIVAVLFFLAQRCRHPVLRRRALATLQGLRRQEANWRSDGAARVVERIISTEEHDAHELAAGVGPPPWPVDEGFLRSGGFLQEPTDEEVDRLMAVPWQMWSARGFRPPSVCEWRQDGVHTEQIPGRARIKAVVVYSEFHKRQIQLRLIKDSADPAGLFGAHEDVVVSF